MEQIMVSMTWAHNKVIHAYWSTNVKLLYFFLVLTVFLSKFSLAFSKPFQNSFFAYISLTSVAMLINIEWT